MRLDLESIAVGPSASQLVVTGVVDWSTIAGFRARLSACVAPPRPDVSVDLAGLLSWSREAQAALVGASMTARLRGGRLVVVGLPPIPRWEAGDCALPTLPAQ
jgi:anti-anti-sigma regulatory factor